MRGCIHALVALARPFTLASSQCPLMDTGSLNLKNIVLISRKWKWNSALYVPSSVWGSLCQFSLDVRSKFTRNKLEKGLTATFGLLHFTEWTWESLYLFWWIWAVQGLGNCLVVLERVDHKRKVMFCLWCSILAEGITSKEDFYSNQRMNFIYAVDFELICYIL